MINEEIIDAFEKAAIEYREYSCSETGNTYRIARNALKGQSKVSEWQSIETAPRDGSNILIIARGAYSPQARVGWWRGDGFAFYSRPEDYYAGGVTIMLEASHWQPLPTIEDDDRLHFRPVQVDFTPEQEAYLAAKICPATGEWKAND